MSSIVMTRIESSDSHIYRPPSGSALRIFVYEQCEIFRAGICAVVDSAPDMTVVGEADDPDGNPAILRTAAPSAVLIGLASVASTLRAIHSVRSVLRVPVPMMVLSGTADDDAIVAVLSAGVRGMLHRDVSAVRLEAAIRSVVEGGLVLGPRVADCLVATIVAPGPVGLTPTGQPPAELRALTPRQQEVMRLVADGLSNTDIASRMHVTVATVKSHLSETLQKLAVRDRTQLAVLAHQHGLTMRTGGTGQSAPAIGKAPAFRPSTSRSDHDRGRGAHPRG